VIYQNFHKHTSLSHRYNKDSPLVHMDYFKYIKEIYGNQPQIYSTVEHGWQGNYFKIYDELEKFNKKNETNIKFIFGTEAYWVKDRFEKDGTNCHIILLAKNDNGRKKLNRAIYESYKTGYYYKGRMDLDLLLSLPKDDIFVTTACVAFWGYDKHKVYEEVEQIFAEGDGSQETKIHPKVVKEVYYDKSFKETDEVILKLANHFTDFYLEVQSHNTDLQRDINKHIVELHEKYNIPYICGVDSHIIDENNMEDREDLLRSNNIKYDEEDGWYMDYPTIDVLVDRFKKQGVLSDEQIEISISNTNKILEFEDIVLDRKIKVPVAKKYKHLPIEERNKIFRTILQTEWKEQISDINRDKYEQYIKEIKHDMAEIEGCQMADYFIDNYEIMKLGIEKGGILTPSGRGSAVSMYLNKLLRFTKVDKVNSPVLMYSERFLTRERILDSKTPPDVDHNVSVREPFIEAQKEIICEEGTFDLLALGTLHYKSAFKMYARAYNLDPTLANEVTKQISSYENDLKYIEDEDEKDLMDIYDYVDKEKYGHLIDGCQQYMGIVDNIKSHPCGTLCYDGDAIEDVGVIMVRSESTGRECFVALIESGTIDAFGYLKQDYLIVDSIGLTYKIYDEIGIEPMSVNKLLDTIKTDTKTWDIYKDGYTMCVNQAEQPKSTKKVKVFMPKNISELTQWISGIRPAFKSMYKIFEGRQHFDYGIKAFDNLIQDEYCDSSFILYQEHLMKVLAFAGFEVGETYNIIKAISKKKEYIIKDAKEKFIPNFAKAILETKETDSEDEALKLSETVWTIVENSASYGFNCVSKDTKIKRSSPNGRFEPTVEEMYKIMNDINYAKETNHYHLRQKYNRYGYGTALSMGDDEIVRENKIIDITPSGIRQTYKVVTKNGSNIVCTDNHKFPTKNGEVKLSNLKVGDNLYCLGKYKQKKFDSSLTNGDFESNLPIKGQMGFQYKPNGVSVVCDENGIPTYLDEIVSIEPYKIEQTYNVEMEDPNHNFISESGLITSNSAHAYCMAIDSVTLAWQKAHYPLEFYKIALQWYTDKGKKDKVSNLKQEMLQRGIQLKPIKFGDDNRVFSIDKDANCINQTMSSIKDMQTVVPEIVYEIGLSKPTNFMNVLGKLANTKINKKSLDILIRLNYFSEFGHPHQLQSQVKIYADLSALHEKFKTCKQLNKLDCILPIEEVVECCGKQTEKQLREIDNDKLLQVFRKNYPTILKQISAKYPYAQTTTIDLMQYEVELLGYTDIKDASLPHDMYMITKLETNNWGTCFASLYQCNSGIQKTIKFGKIKKKPVYNNDLAQGNIVIVATDFKKKGRYDENHKWIESNEYEELIISYAKIK